MISRARFWSSGVSNGKSVGKLRVEASPAQRSFSLGAISSSRPLTANSSAISSGTSCAISCQRPSSDISWSLSPSSFQPCTLNTV